MQSKIKYFIAATFLLSLLLIFKNLFLGKSLAWGDSPFLVTEAFKEILREPLAWEYRGLNFGGQNLLLWLSPLMLVYAFFGLVLGNDSALRLIFYIPAFVSAALGIFFLAKNYKLTSLGFIFSIFLYLANTYFILLVDGGQVGVVLSYGLFPVAVFGILKYLQRPLFKSYLIALFASVLLTWADPRMFVIALLSTCALYIFTSTKFSLKQIFIPLILLLISLLGLNMYWIYPLLNGGFSSLSLDVAQLQLVSVLHGLLLYQPHWPLNQYGISSYPSVIFLVFPIVFLIALLNQKTRKISSGLLICLAVFVFLAKGEAPPLGFFYSQLLSLPFGSTFRDSSKFYAPIMLFASLIVGIFINTKKSKLIILGIFAAILITIIPSLKGEMSFVLSGRSDTTVKSINEEIMKDKGFSRSVWFPERHPQGLELRDNQALNGKELANLRIFANKNVGSGDRYNFMYDPSYLEWFSLLGIQNLVLIDNPRRVLVTREEEKEWDNFQSLVKSQNGIKQTDNLPIYSIENSQKNHFLGSSTAISVIGSDSIVSPNIPMIFLEDAYSDPSNLLDVIPSHLSLYFYKTSHLDLHMSFLKNHFIQLKSLDNNWSTWASSEYLKLKYELLIRGVEFKELDFGRGVAFSTNKNEKLVKSYRNLKPGKYYFAIRASTRNGSITVDVDGAKSDYSSEKLNWYIQEIKVDNGNVEVAIVNNSELGIINTFALIDESEWNIAKSNTEKILKSFNILSDNEFSELVAVNHYQPVEISAVSPFMYKVASSGNSNWIFMSDSYNNLWKLKRGNDIFDNFSSYGEFNLFYHPKDWYNTTIFYEGQYNVRWGVYLSALSFMVISIVGLLYWNRYAKYN